MVRLLSGLPIKLKLFATLLLFSLLVVGVSFAMASWAFQEGFLRFVASRQASEAERLADKMAQIHHDENGWDLLLADENRWSRLHKEVKIGADSNQSEEKLQKERDKLKREGEKVKPSRPAKPPKAGKYVLLDAERHFLIGREREAELVRLVLTPIRLDGQLLGYVGAKAATPLSDTADIRFSEGLLQRFGLIALGLCGICILLAWPLAHLFTRPLRHFAEASGRLSAGHLDTRVPVASRDEFGALAVHFNQMASQLEDVEQQRRAWLADVSHELRTPLALLKAELEVLQDGLRPFDARSVASLQRACGRLEALVQDLHQLALADAERLVLHPQTFLLDSLLQEHCAAWRADFAEAGLQLELQLPGVACPMHGDPRLLGQLVDNLLDNSRRYTDEGGRMQVQLQVKDQVCEVRFNDSAPGVEAALHERIFERFFRVEGSRSRSHGGAGLGLAICRRIAFAHQGMLQAGPSVLGGLEMILSLPVGAAR